MRTGWFQQKQQKRFVLNEQKKKWLVSLDKNNIKMLKEKRKKMTPMNFKLHQIIQTTVLVFK